MLGPAGRHGRSHCSRVTGTREAETTRKTGVTLQVAAPPGCTWVHATCGWPWRWLRGQASHWTPTFQSWQDFHRHIFTKVASFFFLILPQEHRLIGIPDSAPSKLPKATQMIPSIIFGTCMYIQNRILLPICPMTFMCPYFCLVAGFQSHSSIIRR